MDRIMKVMERVDWDLLAEQKQSLINILWERDRECAAWGIVNMLDTLQDAAHRDGLWTYPTCREEAGDGDV